MIDDPRPLVLVVEDEAPNLALFRAILAPPRYRLATASTLAEARQILAATTPAVVVLDVRLPDGNGLTLAEEIKADPRTSAVPVLAVSASVLPSDREAIHRAGCEAFLPKPFRPRDLEAEVLRLASSREAFLSISDADDRR